MVLKKDLLSPFAVFTIGIVINGLLLVFVFPWIMDTLNLYTANRYPDGYDKLAKSIVEGEGYRFYSNTGETTLRAPLYPMFLSVLFKYIGENLLVAQIANFFLTIAIALLTRYLCTITYPNLPLLRTIAPLIVLLHPGIIVAETRGGVEIALTLGILSYITLLVLAIKDRNYTLYFISGVLLGIASLIKSTPLLFPLAFVPYLFYKFGTHKTLSNIGIPTFLILLGISMALSPWIYRNYQLTGKFIPTMSVVGVSMMHGQHICKNISMEKSAGKLIHEATDELVVFAKRENYKFNGYHACCGPFFLKPVDEVRFSDTLKSRAIKQYIEHPLFAMKCSALNLAGFMIVGRSHASTLLNLVVQLPIFALAIIGILKLPSKNHLAVTLFIFIAYYSVVHLPIMALAKHSIPIVPLISIFAASGCIYILSRYFKVSGSPHALHEPSTQ